LLLFLLSHESQAPSGTYVGIDPAEDKINNARRALDGLAEFKVGEVMSLPTEAYDCVSIMDVLYLMPRRDWPELLGHAVRVLRKGGRLIVKEVVDRPCWKRWVTYLEELVAIKLLRMTKGQSPHFESLETYQAAIEQAGAEVIRVQPVGAWRPAAHCLFVARKR
jgi:ubiquinone/menaquinone biosynthesis C-methylase UbiE